MPLLLADFDVKQKSNEGVELRLHHPVTGDETEMVVILAGIDSDEASKLQRETARRYLERLTSPKKKGKLDDEDADGIELLVRCTLGWRNIIWDDPDTPLEFSPENVRMVYSHVPAIREEVSAFIQDRSNFMKVSPTL